MIRRPPRSTQSRSSAASDVYKRQRQTFRRGPSSHQLVSRVRANRMQTGRMLSLIHISEPTRLGMISYAVFCLKKKKKNKIKHPKTIGKKLETIQNKIEKTKR